MSHAKSVKSNSVSFIGHCGTAALSRTGEKGRKGGGWDSCIHHCTLILRNDMEQSMWALTKYVCQTVATGGYGEEMGFGNRENKSRLSISAAQVQTPAAVAGGDALAGRVVERPPQRKTDKKNSPDEKKWIKVSGCTQ